MPWQLSNNNSILYLSIKVVDPAPASQYQFWHFVYTVSLHLGKRRWASQKQKTSSCGPVISWSMAQVSAGQMEQQNQLIFVTAVWQIKSSILMCSLGGTDCFLSEWCFKWQHPWVSSLLILLGLIQSTTSDLSSCKENRNKVPAMQTIDFFPLWRAST